MGITLEIQEKLNKLLEEAADYAENINRSYQSSERSAENLSRQYGEQVNLLDKIMNASKDVMGFLTQGVDSGLDRHLREVSETAEVTKNTISGAMSEIGRKFNDGTAGVDRLNRSLRSTSEGASTASNSFGSMTSKFHEVSDVLDIEKQIKGKPGGGRKFFPALIGAIPFILRAGPAIRGVIGAVKAGGGVVGALKGLAGGFFGGGGGGGGGFFGGLLDMAKALIPVLLKIGEILLAGIGKTLSFLFEVGRAYLGLWWEIGGAIAKVGMAIIAFPFQIFDGLIKMAQSGGGSSEYAEMLEKIRQQFGYLNKTAGGTIKALAKSMKGDLADTGLRVSRVFGNLTKRLEYFFEYVKNLGELADAVLGNLKNTSAEALGAFNKGLGFTEAGQKAIAQRAITTGQDINEVNRQVANYAIQLSDAFGLTMKTLSRDVGEMMADFEHFGNTSIQELTQTAAYARKLGIEVKSLGKLVDKFLNFEDAANSAAQLSQAFGMNIDAFKLMAAGPAEQLEMLRKGFFATGRSFENLNVQERRILATQTSLSESELALAFAQKNRSVSYDEIKKKGNAAQKSQLTQAQALEKLAGAIERLVKSGSPRQGGFFDQFLQGFLRGIQLTKEFRDLMRALRQSLAIVFNAGVRVGKLFMDLFPGVKEYFTGLTALFNPRIMRRFMNEVVDIFREFFELLTTDPTVAVPQLLNRLQQAFTDRFNDAGPGARLIFEGIKKFFTAVGYIILTGIKEAILKVGEVIVPLLRQIFFGEMGPEITGGISGQIQGVGGQIVRMFNDVFGSPETKTRIIEALKAIGKFLYDGFRKAALWFISTIPDQAKFLAAILKRILAALRGEMDDPDSIFGALKKALSKAFEELGPVLKDLTKELVKLIATAIKNILTDPETWKFLKEIAGIMKEVLGAALSGVWKDVVGPVVRDALKGLPFGFGDTISNQMFGPETQEQIAERARRTAAAAAANTRRPEPEPEPNWFSRILRTVTRAIEGEQPEINRRAAQAGANAGKEINDNYRAGVQNGLQQPSPAPSPQGGTSIPNIIRNTVGGVISRIRDALPSFLRPAQEAGTNTGTQVQNNYNTGLQQGMAQGTLDVHKIAQNQSKKLNKTIQDAMSSTAATTSPNALGNSAITEQVSSIREAIKTATDVGNINQKKAKKSLEKLKQFAELLAPELEKVQTAFNNAFQNIDISKINQTLNSIKSLFTSISEIQKAISARTAQIKTEDFRPILKSMIAIKDFTASPDIEKVVTGEKTNQKIQKIKELADTVKSLVDEVKEVKTAMTGEEAQVTSRTLSPLLNSVSAINRFVNSDTLTAIGQQLNSAEVALRISGIKNTSNAITDMVRVINSTSEELSRLSPVNIQSNLKNLGTNLGLGNTAAYTISNKNFTVTVNVDVHMDAKELENTLVDRKGTRIQHTPRK